MKTMRLGVLAGLLALVFTVAPPVGQTLVHAIPVTLEEVLHGLPTESVSVARSGGDETGLPAVARSEAVEAPLTFNMLGVRAPDDADAVRVRVSLDGEQWTNWEGLEFYDAYDGPDPGSAEEQAARSDGQNTAPMWVEEASYLQVEIDGANLDDIEVMLIDSMGSSGGPVERRTDTRLHTEAAAFDGIPQVVTRAEWGADESLRSGSPSYARQVHIGVVHHTAHTTSSSANTYSREQAPAIMRGMYRYHTRANGWSDIGYNLVIDRFGVVYEGRAGGIGRSVIGAHARGYNTGSFGVSVIGNFNSVNPSSISMQRLSQVIGWQSAIHGIDPTGWTNQMHDGVWRPTIVGHRDVGQTSCPGRIQGLLPSLREGATEFSDRFPDVALDSPHRDAILELADAGVTNGCRPNVFCPLERLTRDQAASFVVRAFEIEPIPGQRFPDVPATNVHAGAVNALAELGWILGREDGTFAPREHLTRGQLASVLARSLEEPPDGWPEIDDWPYPDLDADHVHAPGILALWHLGVRGDCGGGGFCPNDDILRDSTASFVNMVRKLHLPPEELEASEELDESEALEEADEEVGAEDPFGEGVPVEPPGVIDDQPGDGDPDSGDGDDGGGDDGSGDVPADGIPLPWLEAT